MGVLVLLFIIVPAVELALLIEIGGQIGGLRTLMLIVLTGIVGASLARRAGLDVLARIQAETQAGRLPAGALVDGALVLLAGALLVTPGILTDVVGFGALIPGVRNVMKRLVMRYFERAAASGKVQVGGFGPPAPPRAAPRDPGFGPIIDVSPPSEADRQPPRRTP